MKGKCIPVVCLLLLWGQRMGAQSNCPDELKERIYARCIRPYFENLNRLMNQGKGFESSQDFRTWTGLFVEPDEDYHPQDFFPRAYETRENKLSESLKLGPYIVLLQNHWGGQKATFKRILLEDVYFAKIGDKYLVVFNKYISGALKIKNDVIDDAYSDQWLQLTLNSQFKIEKIQINPERRAPEDRDGDRVIDYFDGRRTDQAPRPGLLQFNGRPDSDCDGVEDQEDKCPNAGVRGKIASNGCPDRDGDGVSDDEDREPDVPGLIRCQGGRDQDNDGVCDYKDDCKGEKGNNRRGCLRPAKPYLLTLQPFYGAIIPLRAMGQTIELLPPDYNWQGQAGFTSISPLHGGLSLDITPLRFAGIGVDAFYWQLPFNEELFGRLLDSYYSRRVGDYENAIVSAAAYQGYGIVGRLPLGLLRRRFSVRAEPQFGYLYPQFSDNQLRVLLRIQNAPDVSVSAKLFPEKIQVYGLNIGFSINWGEEPHTGLELRASYLRGALTPQPGELNPIANVPPVPIAVSKFEMLRLTLGLRFSFWEI